MSEMPFDQHPQTPQSPSNTSFETADLPPKPTSPRVSNSLPTPAHSVNGSMSSLNQDPVQDASTQVEESNKRKRDVEDHGDREQKKVHVEDSRISIEDLHLDVGKKYLLCRTPHPVTRPNVSENMFDLYSLNDIAASVARTRPNGEKNVIRKTYKGYMKNLGLSGAFDAVKKETTAPDTLFAMAFQPEEEWNAQNIRGKSLEGGLSDAVTNAMGKALTMAKGAIPKDAWNNTVLGEVGAPPAAVEPPRVIPNGVKAPVVQNAGVTRPAAKADIPRPKRNVKKRTYGDSSFEGYGEGYVDDDLQDTGYSTGDGDDRAGSRNKRLKKTGPSHNFQQGPLRQNSYGPGMVGA